MVPEVLLVHEFPSGEVRMVPEFPTPTNNTLEVVVELSVVVVVDLLLLQEKRREENIRMEMNSIFFTWFPNYFFKITQNITSIGLDYNMCGDFLTW